MNTNLKYVKSFQIWKPNSAHFLPLSLPKWPNNQYKKTKRSNLFMNHFKRSSSINYLINMYFFSARVGTTIMILPKWTTVFTTKLGKRCYLSFLFMQHIILNWLYDWFVSLWIMIVSSKMYFTLSSKKSVQ